MRILNCDSSESKKSSLVRGALGRLILLLSCACQSGTAPDTNRQPAQPGRTPRIYASVSVGQSTACALDAAGRAYCWGSDYFGGLAVGESTYRVTLPTPLTSGPSAFTAVTVGAHHQCALANDGRAYCWGDNLYGQLGTGGLSRLSVVTPVAGGLTFTAISAGYSHTCAIATDQTAYCWGNNDYGALGAGSAAPCDYSKLPCSFGTPVPVSGGLHFSQISAGRFHSCGVTTDGNGYCWGDNADGELGDPSVPIQCGGFPVHATCERDAPVLVSGGLRFRQVAAGAFHSCGVTTANYAYCWGHVTRDSAILAFALGNPATTGEAGTSRGSRIPVPVVGGFSFREISTGDGVSCGLTLSSEAVCWGWNNYGQLGVGSMSPSFSTTPAKVRMPAAQHAPVLGEGENSCALATTGVIWCWGGYNFVGELGSDPLSDPGISAIIRPVPAPVQDPP